MLPLPSIAIATILLTATAPTSLKVTSTEIEERSEIFENSDIVHYEDVNREKREIEEQREEEALNPLRRESSADELAAAVGLQNVGYQDTGKYVSEHPRQAVGGGWRDAVPGTPGMDYPNLDEIPVTSFTCMDKEPGGYYADIETGCQVFHVCNTGGVKSSFLCPPGSIFNQKHFVCDWWYGFNCQEAVDFYFKKSETNFADLDEDSDDYIFENSETTTAVSETFDSPAGKYSQDSRIENNMNPPNKPSLTGSRQTIIDHPSTQGSRQIDETNVRNYHTDSRSHKNLNDDSSEDYKPKGFSRNNKKSFKRRKFNTGMISHDSTNDLASYVNYAYFQAGFNNNGNHNDGDDNDDDDIRTNFDTIKLEYRSRNSKGIDEYE